MLQIEVIVHDTTAHGSISSVEALNIRLESQVGMHVLWCFVFLMFMFQTYFLLIAMLLLL